MRIRVTTWRHVIGISCLITALAVAVPLIVVAVALAHLPMIFKIPIFMIAGLIPLFIAFPISLFALLMLRKLNETVTTLDDLMKFDMLTGLLSRMHFMHLLGNKRKNGGYLILVDADHFKQVNDSHGHEAGDIALKHLASSMSQVVGNSGFVGRLGGEEFAIYLPGSKREQALLIAATLGSTLRNQSFNYRGQDIQVTISLGVAEDRPDFDVTCTLRRADNYLYVAKRNGRDRYEVEETLDEKVATAA